MGLDADIAAIVLLCLQIVQLLLQTYLGYHQAQKARRAEHKREQKKELMASVSFLTAKHAEVGERTATLQEWMDILLKHKNLPHSSSTGMNTS